MATKPTFSKLNLTKDIINEKKTIKINDIEIEVKQYLPINDKLGVIQNVINFVAADELNTGRKFKNPVQLEVVQIFEIIRAYTNLNFTEKQLTDNIDKTYDLLETNDVINDILSAIPAEEYKAISEGIDESVEEYYKYKNSAFGIMEMFSTQYQNINFDVDKLREKLQDDDTFKILPEIMDKLN